MSELVLCESVPWEGKTRCRGSLHSPVVRGKLPLTDDLTQTPEEEVSDSGVPYQSGGFWN